VHDLRSNPLRTALVFPLFLAAVAVLAGRLYHVQVQSHSALLELAWKQSRTTVTLPAMRGSIRDCHGRPLAASLNTPAVFADPGIIAVPSRIRTWLPKSLGLTPITFRKFLLDRPKTLSKVNDPTLASTVQVTRELAAYLRLQEDVLLVRLGVAVDLRIRDAARKAAPLLGVPEGELRRTFSRPTRFVWLRRPADNILARQIKALKLRGVCVKLEPRRQTEDRLSIAQWLGLVGPDSKGRIHGTEGLERLFDRELCGTPGLARLSKDGRGKKIASSADPAVPPRNGCDLYLTIDTRIQNIVDAELRQVYQEFAPVAAAAIVMEPSTARILAMDSEPGLDGSKRSEMSTVEIRRRLRNHAVQSVFEYGSTYKPIVLAAALDLGLVTPQTKIHCENGRWKYRKRVLHDTHPYGVLTAGDGVVHSSNILAAKLGLMLGDTRLRRCVLDFGFGTRSGICLPAEEPGTVTPARKWSYWTTTSVPMGQEIAGTPLQLLTAFCALINGGKLLQPYLVEAVHNPNTGEKPSRRSPHLVRRVIKPQTSAAIRRILAAVVERGTGKALRDCKYRIGGKTGTAQRRDPAGGYSDQYVASFVGFAPVDRPKIAVLVLVDAPQGSRYYGSQVAAPAVGRIIDRTLAMLGATPQAGAPDIAATQGTP